MIQIYKPNKSNTGCAGSFFISQYDCVMLQLIQQFSWDEKTKTGSFKENKKHPQNSISVKLNLFECGELINSILRRQEWSGFHSFEGTKTRIGLSLWKQNEVLKGFGIFVEKNVDGKDLKFKIPLTLGEAEVVKILLEEFVKRQCNKKVTKS